MRFLILTPVLNGAEFIDANIRSIRAQSHHNFLHVILDGGSTDGSVNIAQSHAAQDSRVILLQGRDKGMYDALRTGFERFAGEADVLSWLNCDDLYAPWALSVAAEAMEKGPQWITGLPGLFDSLGRLRAVLPRGPLRRADILAGRHHDGFLGAIQQESVFFAKSLYDDLSEAELDQFGKQKFAGDFFLWRCFAKRANLQMIPSVLGGFRLHGGNRSIVMSENYAEEACKLGAAAPAPVVGRLWRRISDLASALKALRAYESASHRLATEARHTFDANSEA